MRDAPPAPSIALDEQLFRARGYQEWSGGSSKREPLLDSLKNIHKGVDGDDAKHGNRHDDGDADEEDAESGFFNVLKAVEFLLQLLGAVSHLLFRLLDTCLQFV